jgi:nucleotide-binding universal stress UspA family protein
MKRILVPTDFSENAAFALKVAAQIAKKNDGEIILLHMLELASQAGDAMGSGHDLPELMLFKNKAIERLEDLMDEDYLDGIEVSEIVQFEKAFDGIIKLSKQNNVDLIVMGSHGASGFKELIIGSNTEKVVRFSDIPVLVIKKDTDDFRVEKFVFASDFSDEAKKPFAKAIEFANKFNSELHLVMINTPNDFKTTAKAQKIIEDFLIEFKEKEFKTHIYSDLNKEKGIINFAKSIDADLIGIGTHGRKGISHFFNGSVSEDIVNHAKRPVVTFKI